MGLVDLFRPKWKHSKAEVRAEALRGLGAGDTEIIAGMARNDADEAVRRVAVEKLEDPELLSSIARDDTSKVGVFAGQRAARLWVDQAATASDVAQAESALARLGDPKLLATVVHRAKAAAVRTAALERLTDTKVLADLVREASDAGVRLEVLRRITDVATLRGIAIAGEPREAAFAAIEQLGDVEALEAVVKSARSKNLKNRAKKRLAVLVPAPPPEPAPAPAPISPDVLYVEQSRLLAAVERAVTEKAFERADEIAAVGQTWARIHDRDPELSERFERATEEFGRELAIHRAAVAEAERKRAAERERERIAAEARARAREAERAQEAAAAPVEPAAPEPEPPPPPRPAPKPELTPEERAQKALQTQAELEQTCLQLEQALDTTKLRVAQDLLKRAASLFARPGNVPSQEIRKELDARYEAARLALVAKVRELAEAEEWREWASLGKQKTLVERVQALQAAADERPDLAAELKALQDEWKTVRGVPSAKGQALWDEFRRSCDAVYDRIKLQHAGNLARKEELCERAESLRDSTDWGGTANALRDLQAVWKTIGPVARSDDKKVWDRFRGACDHFFARRKEAGESLQRDHAKNLERKEALIAKVEGLAEGVVDEATWKRATAEVKAIQATWRDIGHVPRSAADDVHKRFRAACDRVFARLDDMQRERDAAEAERVGAAREQARATLHAEAPTPEALVAIWSQVHGLGDDDLVAACERACAAALAADPQAFAGTELDPPGGLRRKEKLCARVEALSPRNADPRPLSEQLKSALATNALGVAKDAAQDSASQVKQARAAWRRIGPTPGEEGRALDARFEAACTAASSSAEAPSEA